MSTYMENIYNNNENNNFQSTYDSIINELINLENLTPDKSRATFLESIFKQLCTVTNSSAAFIFELFNNFERAANDLVFIIYLILCLTYFRQKQSLTGTAVCPSVR